VRHAGKLSYGERYSALKMVAGMPDFPRLSPKARRQGVLTRAPPGLRTTGLKPFAHPRSRWIDVRVRRKRELLSNGPPGAATPMMVGLPAIQNRDRQPPARAVSLGSSTVTPSLTVPSVAPSSDALLLRQAHEIPF